MAARGLKVLLDVPTGALAAGTLRAVKRLDRKRMADFAGRLMRKIGPLFKEHRLGRENLRLAFPEKSAAEIETILDGVWDNLGRFAVEVAHFDEFHLAGLAPATANVITYPPDAAERSLLIMKRRRPIIGFAAHLANWELPALGAKLLGAKSAVLFRRTNIDAVSELIVRLREPLMGELVPTGLDAPVRLARLLQSGVHVGMLVDQHYTRGVEVTFFARKCLVNPLIAMLARQTECPIHGIRVVRKPDGNSFWGEVTDEIEPARDVNGRVEVAGTMQRITSVVEGWVREHPEQWLWLHRRWR
jgi:Kdo2-lipid IVA lauroyltransferase/acyltransferase